MAEIIKLASSQEHRPVHGCGTCRFYDYYKMGGFCNAVSRIAIFAYRDDCEGKLWEAKPPFVPILVRFKRWLIG